MKVKVVTESKFANKICTNSEANANNVAKMSHQPTQTMDKSPQ